MTAPASETPITELLPHRHQWFSTGHMKPGQMRCYTCGKWGEEYDAEKERIAALEYVLTPILSRLQAIQREGGTPHQLVLTQEEIAGLLKLNDGE